MLPNITTALTTYERKKGTSEDHPSIKALRELSVFEQDDLFSICQCFSDHIPDKQDASYEVYQVVLDEIFPYAPEVVDALNRAHLITKENVEFIKCLGSTGQSIHVRDIVALLISNHFLTQSNIDVVKRLAMGEFKEKRNLAQIWMILNTLQYNELTITQEIFDSIFNLANPGGFKEAVESLENSGHLTQDNLLKLLQPANADLHTPKAQQIAWRKIPYYLLTQEVLDQSR